MHQSNHQEYDVQCLYALQDDTLDDNPCAECKPEGEAADHADDGVPPYQYAGCNVAQADDAKEKQSRDEIRGKRGVLQEREGGAERVVDVCKTAIPAGQGSDSDNQMKREECFSDPIHTQCAFPKAFSMALRMMMLLYVAPLMVSTSSFCPVKTVARIASAG